MKKLIIPLLSTLFLLCSCGGDTYYEKGADGPYGSVHVGSNSWWDIWMVKDSVNFVLILAPKDGKSQPKIEYVRPKKDGDYKQMLPEE